MRQKNKNEENKQSDHLTSCIAFYEAIVFPCGYHRNLSEHIFGSCAASLKETALTLITTESV